MTFRADRLANVSRALRESPAPERFTMRRFTNQCGSPACAFGHYAARADLQQAFYLDTHGSPLSIDGEHFVDTIKTHFGIDELETTELFGGFGCDNAQTPEAAAAYIDCFIERKLAKGARL